ncbi:hypothetical protein ABTX61_21445 [Amycolatopsis japonica]|uniref:hypothetical protein n=1 Tax=Amycolatopsis japonica TaxID=208439 RepID=UPI003330615A
MPDDDAAEGLPVPESRSADNQPHPTVDVNDKKPGNGLAIVSVIATAVVGMVGVGGIIWASKLSVDASIRNQDVQIAEARDKESRDRKADIYLRFLGRADEYSLAVLEARRCIYAARDSKPKGAKSYSLGRQCIDTVQRMAPARHKFQGVRNEVFVHGSQEAENAARRIADYLPRVRNALAN